MLPNLWKRRCLVTGGSTPGAHRRHCPAAAAVRVNARWKGSSSPKEPKNRAMTKYGATVAALRVGKNLAAVGSKGFAIDAVQSQTILRGDPRVLAPLHSSETMFLHPICWNQSMEGDWKEFADVDSENGGVRAAQLPPTKMAPAMSFLGEQWPGPLM